MMRENTTVAFARMSLLETQLEELKRLVGTTTTKDALQAAGNLYLSCPVIRERSKEEEKGGRMVVNSRKPF